MWKKNIVFGSDSCVTYVPAFCPQLLCTERDAIFKYITENFPIITQLDHAEDLLIYLENFHNKILSITSAEEKWVQYTWKITCNELLSIAVDPKRAILCGHSPKEMHDFRKAW